MHDSMQTAAAGLWTAAYFPALYWVSRRVKPASCALFTGVWAYAYFRGVTPTITGRLQAGLNSTAAPYMKKYGVKTDEDYLSQ